MNTRPALAFFLALTFAFTAPLAAAERVVFASDWRAQAEHGGFYQALGEGLYKKRGLDVVIKQGSADVNVPQLVAAGAVDFGLGSNAFIPLNLVAVGAKVKAVMASFQKDPQVLITHPRTDIKSIADMKGKPIMVSDATISAFWIWLRAKYGFEDKQIRKYTFSLAPFLVDPKAIQQGYVTSEPYLIAKTLKKEPQVFLLADAGYPGYAAMVLAPDKLIKEKPKLVQDFVEATIEGWAHYLYGNPAAGNALILKDNSEMTPELIAEGIKKMKAYGIVDSGDTKKLGIGAMTDARWKDFYDTMAAQGLYKKTLNYRDAYTLQFINRGVGKQ